MGSADTAQVLPERALPQVSAVRCTPLTARPADAMTPDAEGIGIHYSAEGKGSLCSGGSTFDKQHIGTGS